jgi:hypothetical protein
MDGIGAGVGRGLMVGEAVTSRLDVSSANVVGVAGGGESGKLDIVVTGSGTGGGLVAAGGDGGADGDGAAGSDETGGRGAVGCGGAAGDEVGWGPAADGATACTATCGAPLTTMGRPPLPVVPGGTGLGADGVGTTSVR